MKTKPHFSSQTDGIPCKNYKNYSQHLSFPFLGLAGLVSGAAGPRINSSCPCLEVDWH